MQIAINTIKYAFRVLVRTVKNFTGDYCFRYSASLSFYTLFSIAPMVMVSVHAAGILASDIDFQGELIRQFTNLVGERGAEGVTVLIDTLEDEETTGFQLMIGTVVLAFSATNIFVQLQSAFNEIFSVVSSGRGWIKKILDRVISLGIILSLGLVMMVSLVIDSAVVLLQAWLIAMFPDIAVIFISLIQYLVLALLATAEIYALLHFLPDVHIPTKYKLRGCVFITLLLVFGKSAIGWYIGNSQFNELGGASASVIVLMLWIYYSSLIVFFGAELIKSMATIDNVVLRPKRYASKVESVLVEEKKQQKEENKELEKKEEAELAPSTDAANSAEPKADEMTVSKTAAARTDTNVPTSDTQKAS
ncbi:MAG: YihY/virulence factor BrkB family protein [Pseudomonadota bacterium]